MLLIFSLCRPDVLSWGDFGIRRGMALLYGDRQLTRERFERRRRRYTPYGSVVSLYLWALAGMEDALARQGGPGLARPDGALVKGGLNGRRPFCPGGPPRRVWSRVRVRIGCVAAGASLPFFHSGERKDFRRACFITRRPAFPCAT